MLHCIIQVASVSCCLQVQQSLQSEHQQVQALKQERSGFEEAMKRAFMRGVCALNMEAMSMFNAADDATAGARG